MKKTFATTMPDRAGAFGKADACLARLGLNITRVSYNRALDAHMLFLEAEGSPEQLALAEEELKALGYLQNEAPKGSVLLLDFLLPDKPGALYPVLELITRYEFNITYISGAQDDRAYQHFKMALYIEDGEKASAFMKEAAMLCRVRVLDYDKSEKILDNTVFYLSFANTISQKMGLDENEKQELIVSSNRIMQMLDERNLPFYKTFDYIGRFADAICRGKGAGYNPRVTRHQTAKGVTLTLIEPPCGSNTAILELGDTLLFIDCGFACYRTEWEAHLRTLYKDLDRYRKVLCLSHADVDHVGNTDFFDEVIVNQSCYENFAREREGLPAFREENLLHEPYVRISKLLSAYRAPDPSSFTTINQSVHFEEGELLSYIGLVVVGELTFEAYEGRGGHVRGEMILLERAHRLVFTGDIFVNLKAYTKEQAAFNRLAPYLMTSVDTDPALAKAEREAIPTLLTEGSWQVFGAHGGVYELMV